MPAARRPQVLTRSALRERVALRPRIPLAHLPTPLDEALNLSRALGPRILIKRDDATGLAFGGNKTRQLEFLMADARAQGADTIVACAATQSNFCRQTTAAARKLGMDVALLLSRGVKGTTLQGNLLLDHLMGAAIEFVDFWSIDQFLEAMEAKAEALRRQGKKPYVMDMWRQLTPIAAVAYVDCFLELADQLDQRGIAADYLYLSGANITPAGLALAAKATGSQIQVVGVTPMRWEEDRPTDIARIANATAQLLGIDTRLTPQEIKNLEGYIGQGYGMVSEQGAEAIKLVARTEGLFLDPVYSSKGMAGLIDQIRQGHIRPDQTVVFLHTGGTPALFAYHQELTAAE
ncbi:MAG: D-cysteine desulfhydrase family protein [Deinococcus sp.]|nr:D-cysteine desulfhydrase family protein [Deinococcus sp.]